MRVINMGVIKYLQFPDSLRSAIWFWVYNSCYVQADKGIGDAAVDAVTKIVNSGEIKKNAEKQYPKPHENPVLLRRQFTKDAYYAFI